MQEEYLEFIQRFPQYMIASYLGITKEFLSYIKSQIFNLKETELLFINFDSLKVPLLLK